MFGVRVFIPGEARLAYIYILKNEENLVELISIYHRIVSIISGEGIQFGFIAY